MISMIISILSVIGACISVAVPETSFDSVVYDFMENRAGTGEYEFLPAALYFNGGSDTSFKSWNASVYGDYTMFVVLSYLDFYFNEQVVTETNDWYVTVNNTADYTLESPVLMLRNMDLTWTYVSNYAYNHNLVYYLPNTTNYDDHPYFYEFLSSYLSSRGFEEDEENITNDYSLSIVRGTWLFYYVPGDGWNSTVTDGCREQIVDNIDNNRLSIVTLQSNNVAGYSSDYPYLALGYHCIDEFTESYSIFCFNPNVGLAVVNDSSLWEVTTVDFHGAHKHSNNFYDEYAHLYRCPCGYTSATPHNVTNWQSVSSASHQGSCPYCGETISENHDFHYTRINNLKHRKYCSKCTYSVLENHSGPYCICMLGDL